jgi:hypothetical protein
MNVELTSDERVVYSGPEGLRITNRRVLTSTQTLAVGSLGRVWSQTHTPTKVPWVLLGLSAVVLGALLMLVPVVGMCGLVFVPAGIVFIVVGLAYKTPKPTRFSVLATTQGQSVVILTTVDQKVADDTVGALSSVLGSQG